MTHATSDKNMDNPNGDQNNDVIPNFPGGKPQTLPDEPVLPEGLLINLSNRF